MTLGQLLTVVAVQTVMGSALYVLGRWGRTRADDIVPTYLDPDERWRRVDVVRRGGVTCQVAGAAVLASVLVAFVVFAVGGT